MNSNTQAKSMEIMTKPENICYDIELQMISVLSGQYSNFISSLMIDD